jgi:hypothetical protein
MAEITSGTPIAAPASVPPAAATATPSTLQKIEIAVFAFAQAHYGKLVSAGVGFAAAKVGIFTIIGKFL